VPSANVAQAPIVIDAELLEKLIYILGDLYEALSPISSRRKSG
jgi:hypothetical protein